LKICKISLFYTKIQYYCNTIKENVRQGEHDRKKARYDSGVLGAEPLGEGVAEGEWRFPVKPGMT
jgi:hypothetical protein